MQCSLLNNLCQGIYAMYFHDHYYFSGKLKGERNKFQPLAKVVEGRSPSNPPEEPIDESQTSS